MIQITDKSKCCGCSACVTSCPVRCIDFNEDEQGFNYPIVDNVRCINCGMCEKVCLYLNDYEEKLHENVFAAIKPDVNIRLKSSSGGFFGICRIRVARCRNLYWSMLQQEQGSRS